MTSHVVRAREPRGQPSVLVVDRSDEAVGRHLEDAAHFTGGHADAVARPRTEAEVAGLLEAASRVLPIGAQSSVTGGATPDGGLVLSTERLTSIQEPGQEQNPRRRGGSARHVAETAASARPLVRTSADVHGRVRRRRGRDQRRGRRDLQVRHDARLGGRAHRRAGVRLRPRSGARPGARRSWPRLRDHLRAWHATVPPGHVSDARRAEVLGGLLRGAGDGSRRSLRRVGGHARRRSSRPRCACCRRRRRSHLRSSRWTRNRSRSRWLTNCGARPRKRGDSRTRAASTSPRSSISIGAVWRSCGRMARIAGTT